MSGNSLPYHLRTNKTVERKIFFEVLNSLVLERDIRDYKYFSLGGPMLEDHHALHYELGLTKLISIERDEATLSRQEFNKPFSCIECRRQTLKSFVDDFDESESDPVIIWFDYTDTKWSTQFQECETILGKLKHQDIFKITFNANPEVLKTDRPDQNQLDVFKQKAASKYVSENLTLNDVMSMDRFAKTLSKIFEAICQNTLQGEHLVFCPLTQYRYIDNRHHMLTVTGIILDETSSESFEESNISTISKHVSFESGWDDIKEINVPDLTQKEKYALNQLLPECSVDLDLSTLPFNLDKKESSARKKLENYIKYYRYIPNFQKVNI